MLQIFIILWEDAPNMCFFINIILNAGCRVGGLVKEESWRHVTYIPLVLLRMPATKFLLLF